MTRIPSSRAQTTSKPKAAAATAPKARASTAATREKKAEPRDIWDALSTPTQGGGRTGRTRVDLNKLSSTQRESLARCEAVVTSLQAYVGANAARLPEDLKGLKAKDITVKWGGDFPYVGVKLNGTPLTDRHFELDTLRKMLPRALQGVPMGDVSPF